MSASLDLFITLLQMGASGYKQLLDQRKVPTHSAWERVALLPMQCLARSLLCFVSVLVRFHELCDRSFCHE